MAANRRSNKLTILSSKYDISVEEFHFGFVFCVFETADLRSYRGYFLEICQLCFLLLVIFKGYGCDTTTAKFSKLEVKLITASLSEMVEKLIGQNLLKTVQVEGFFMSWSFGVFDSVSTTSYDLNFIAFKQNLVQVIVSFFCIFCLTNLTFR